MLKPRLDLVATQLEPMPSRAGVPVYRVESPQPADVEVVPFELYLRGLLALDPTNPEALLEFAAEFGMIHLGEDLMVLNPWYQHPDGKPFPRSSHPPDYLRGAFGDLGMLRLAESDAGYIHGTREHLVLHPLLEISAAVMQSLVRQWLGSFDRASHASAWTWVSVLNPPSNADCVSIFETLVNRLLAPFSPRVAIRDPAEPPPVPLANALALQLMTGIRDGVQPRPCKRCHTLFIRQNGRARHGQHRTTAVDYCTQACSNAASQAEHRKKKKAAKGAER